MTDLSMLIPARNERWLARTVQDILENMRGDTEIIAVLDGAWADPPIPAHPRVTVIHQGQSIGQRAATNLAARLSTARYVMKCDAHCAFDEGFDVKLLETIEDDWTVIPRMYNLHVFDWVCQNCQHRTYQGPKPDQCKTCRGTAFEIDVVWKKRDSRRTDFARFDSELRFQYWGEYSKRPQAQADIADVMCCVGAAWLMKRERYWQIGGLDEAHGSWGQMGVEIACKSWLSGGRQVVNKRTWFAHLFRTQPGFGFPYPISGKDQDQSRVHSRKLWIENTWPGAKYPLDWLINKFAPVPSWPRPASSQLTKGVVYYTDNRLQPDIADAVRMQIRRGCNGHEVVMVSLGLANNFYPSVIIKAKRGVLTMFRQILAGLEACTADIVFMAEHDVLYHPSHFTFVPPKRDVFYYNENVWRVDYASGRALFYYAKQTSGLCAYRDLLIEHYRARVARVEKDGFQMSMGFEPGTHSFPRGVDNHPAERWMSEFPNIDIRHDKNLTPSRWSKDQFRNQKYTAGWTEAEEVPGWGRTADRFDQLLQEIRKTA